MAVVGALNAAALPAGSTGSQGLHARPFRIKWPNDIHAVCDDGSTVKVGGIICQSLAQGSSFSVVAGLGVNVDNEEPTTSVNSVLRRHTCGQQSLVAREQLLAAICNELEPLMGVRPVAPDLHAGSMTTWRMLAPDARVHVLLAS